MSEPHLIADGVLLVAGIRQRCKHGEMRLASKADRRSWEGEQEVFHRRIVYLFSLAMSRVANLESPTYGYYVILFKLNEDDVSHALCWIRARTTFLCGLCLEHAHDMYIEGYR